MEASEVNLAGWDHEVAMDQVHDAIRQVRGEIRTVVSTAVLPQPPRHIHPRKALTQRELHQAVTAMRAQADGVEIMPISATNGRGVRELWQTIWTIHNQ